MANLCSLEFVDVGSLVGIPHDRHNNPAGAER